MRAWSSWKGGFGVGEGNVREREDADAEEFRGVGEWLDLLGETGKGEN
jgi:hypothetical protein